MSSAEQERRKLQTQRGMLALISRFFILHASKLVQLMLFWAAMQLPGAFGWLLICELMSSSTLCLKMLSYLIQRLLGADTVDMLLLQHADIQQ